MSPSMPANERGIQWHLPRPRSSAAPTTDPTGDTMPNDQTIARGLGYLSLGLGLSQLFAPRWFARTIGAPKRGETDAVVRLVGLREIVAAGGLLASRNPAPWVWLRVGG